MANKTNAKRGALFEEAVGRFLSAEGVRVTPKFKLHIGVSDQKCSHEFDFGSDESNIVVECKCHSWTEGGNSPSAKLATWNEAMYYFSHRRGEGRGGRPDEQDQGGRVCGLGRNAPSNHKP